MTALSFLATILTIMTAFVGFLVVLRQTGDWPKWQSIPLAIVVSTMCLLAVFTMVHVVFDQQSTDVVPIDDSSNLSFAEQTTNQPSEEGTGPPEEEKEPRMLMETKRQTFSFGTRNSHCRGPRNVRWPVKATPGWEIDVHSITVEPTVQSSRSVLLGVVDETTDGFYIAGRVVNSGDCITVLGRTIARDGRGSLHVKGSYIETRMVPDPG